MDDFSWFGPALFALIAIAWWTHPSDSAPTPTTRDIWMLRLARLVMVFLIFVLIGTIDDFRKLGQPRGGDPDGGVEIPYSF